MLSMAVGLGPGHTVTWGPSSPSPLPEKGTAAPNFPPMSIVTKRSHISATADLLSSCQNPFIDRPSRVHFW